MTVRVSRLRSAALSDLGFDQLDHGDLSTGTTVREYEKGPGLQALCDGASQIRTGELLGAIAVAVGKTGDAAASLAEDRVTAGFPIPPYAEALLTTDSPRSLDCR